MLALNGNIAYFMSDRYSEIEKLPVASEKS